MSDKIMLSVCVPGAVLVLLAALAGVREELRAGLGDAHIYIYIYVCVYIYIYVDYTYM